MARARVTDARILMLTAGVEDRVDGLELGADDYLPKPYALAELVARVRAPSRRSASAPPVVRRGDLTVDLARHRASRGGRALTLTGKEFGILEMLLAADGAVVSAEELLGLAIVASIAAVHGGAATARPRDDGGLFVTVTIPSAAAPVYRADAEASERRGVPRPG